MYAMAACSLSLHGQHKDQYDHKLDLDEGLPLLHVHIMWHDRQGARESDQLGLVGDEWGQTRRFQDAHRCGSGLDHGGHAQQLYT